MAIRDDNSGGEGLFDSGSGWSDDEHPLERLLEFVAPGSRIIYEYSSTAEIGGMLGSFFMAPIVGVARFADHHEYITGMHFSAKGKKCLLDYDEFVGLLKLLEMWLAPHECRPTDGPTVRHVRYETRNGLVIESGGLRWGEVARVSVASPATILLSGSELEKLFRACQEAKVFLDRFRN